MTSPALRHATAALTLLALAATASAQTAPGAASGAGLALGPSASIDAPVLGAPEAEIPTAVVVVRGEGGDRIAVLDLRRHGEALRVTGVLPDLRDHPGLRSADDPALWPCPLAVTADARLLPVGFWVEEAGAVLELANRPLPAAPVAGYRQLLLVYADGDVRVHGSCADPALGLTVEAYLRPGWNLLASEAHAASGGPRVLVRSTTPKDLEDAAWYWRETPTTADDADVTPTRP